MAIHYHRDNENEQLELSGNTFDLVSEVSYLVHKVHCVLYKQNPKLAEAFKELAIKVIGSADSPTWQHASQE